MEIDVTPPLARSEQHALLAALGEAHADEPEGDLYRQAWRVAGLREGARDDPDAGYAFSPRSTRGATRA